MMLHKRYLEQIKQETVRNSQVSDQADTVYNPFEEAKTQNSRQMSRHNSVMLGKG